MIRDPTHPRKLTFSRFLQNVRKNQIEKLYQNNWVKNQAFDFQILWTSLSPDQKLELSSNYVNFFDRLSSFIAFSRLFSCKMVLFLIFLYNENRVQNQAFDFQILWTSLSPDQKLELSSNYVNFFDRLDSFIAFSRLFSFFFFLFLIFLFNDNREIFQDFEWFLATL